MAGLAVGDWSYDEIRYIIYFDNYPLTMVSLYGFQRKQGAETKICGSKPQRGAGSYQGGINEAVCRSVRRAARRFAFGRRRIRARGANDPVGASQQHRPSRQSWRSEVC